MTIIIASVSILAITTFMWLVNRVLSLPVCPICTGVFLTWVGLLSAHVAGYQVDMTVPAILMGGSVVGITYQLEKRAVQLSVGARVLWKMLFIPSGFIAVYAILGQLWLVFFLALIFLFLLSIMFISSRGMGGSRGKTTSNLEKRMEDCC